MRRLGGSTAKKLTYERFYWLHGQIKAGRFPNAAKMSRYFEISQKQAQRDIEFMKDRLGAPLSYNHLQRGYEYGDSGYELPPVWFNEDEFLAFCLALRLAAAVPDTKVKGLLHGLLERLLAFRSSEYTAGLEDIKEKVSVKNIQYYKVDGAIFHSVVSGLFADRPLKITYFTPHKGETTERVVLPLHLLCYMGSWHLIAFCTMRGELRDFALSRIRTADPASERIKPHGPVPCVKEYIRTTFGLIGGGESVEVCLVFSPNVAGWVSEQVWHAAQGVSRNEDGSITLRFPVSDFKEVKREILKYGASVEILSPASLREEIAKEIRRMGKIYR